MTAALLELLLLFSTNSRTSDPRTVAVPKIATACAAVTRADVELALGRKVGRGEEDNSNGSSTCDYSSSGGQVTVTMQRLGAAMDLDAEKSSLKAEFPGSVVREIKLEGADAFFLDLNSAGTMLYAIRNGREYVMVAILGFGEAGQVSTAALQLARTALRQEHRLAPHTHRRCRRHLRYPDPI